MKKKKDIQNLGGGANKLHYGRCASGVLYKLTLSKFRNRITRVKLK